jgi:hypothetical protein
LASRGFPVVLALEVETSWWPADGTARNTPADRRDESIANPLWGAPRIHGELLKLGVDIGQTSVAKYMVKRRDPPSQGWRTFLRNHADGAAAMDMFVVPTISFRLLYGRLRSMGIRDRPTSPRSPWQNAYAERLIGSIRRECLDHVVVLGERHLRHILLSYMHYYNDIRTHRSLDKDAPASRPVQRTGIISSQAILGGLHHHYVRV